MEFRAKARPGDVSSLGILGYIIVLNNQVHSYQEAALGEYLGMIGLDMEDTPLGAILNGDDDAITYQKSLEAFLREPREVQYELFYMLHMLSAIDSVIETREQTLIDRISSYLGIEQAELDEIKAKATEDAGRIRNDDKNLFSGEYIEAIEDCTRVAKEDFNFIRPQYHAAIEECAGAIQLIDQCEQSISSGTEQSEQVKEVIDVFVRCLQGEVQKINEVAIDSLDKKERAISDFSVSILGRTKAGKTTLHAVLTNQGFEKIGIGRQRTTRYNRVYQWNLLRIIDTPGIGSAEAAGRKDDEIAASVLGETDIICFVIADDSIQKDILEFIYRIAQLNKPIMVILNHKENIHHPVKYKRFMADPTHWYHTNAEDNLEGHINRLRKVADSGGFGHLITVYPVFLLAAKMALEEEHKEDREVLWESSHIDDFLGHLRQFIISAGTIKKSQTLLDEAAQYFKQSHNTLGALRKELSDQRDNLVRTRSERIAKLKTIENQTLAKMDIAVCERYEKLAVQDAYVFASQHYGDKGDLGPAFNEFLNSIGFERDIQDIIERELKPYQDAAEDTVIELFEDLYFARRDMATDIGRVRIPVQFDFKQAAKLVGAGLDVAGSIALLMSFGSNPLGFGLIAGGLVLGFGSKLLKSKARKRQEAINKIHKAIMRSIEKNQRGQIRPVLWGVRTKLDENIAMIEGIFDELIAGLGKVESIALELEKSYGFKLSLVNRRYALRILQYLDRQGEGVSKGRLFEGDILSVDRSVSDVIRIKMRRRVKPTTTQLKGIIAETIEIE